MRKMLLSAATALALGTTTLGGTTLALNAIATLLASPAQAQQLHLQEHDTDPTTGLSADKWIDLAENIVNGKAVIGKPRVFLVNATGSELTAVNCDKWALVGPEPYIKGNPTSLPAWKVTITDANGFDGYCKQGVKAQDDRGHVYLGRLTSTDGTFSNATFVVFQHPQQ